MDFYVRILVNRVAIAQNYTDLFHIDLALSRDHNGIRCNIKSTLQTLQYRKSTLFGQREVFIKANRPSVTGWSFDDRSESGECNGSGSLRLSKCIKGS